MKLFAQVKSVEPGQKLDYFISKREPIKIFVEQSRVIKNELMLDLFMPSNVQDCYEMNVLAVYENVIENVPFRFDCVPNSHPSYLLKLIQNGSPLKSINISANNQTGIEIKMRIE